MTSALDYLKGGSSSQQKGDHKQAIRDFTAAIQLNENLPEAYVARGISYYKTQEIENAIDDLEKAIELRPAGLNLAEACIQLGHCYQDLGDPKRAITFFTKAIEAHPKYVALGYYFRGDVYYGETMYGSALSDFTKAIEADPNYAPAYLMRGLCYQNKHRLERVMNFKM